MSQTLRREMHNTACNVNDPMLRHKKKSLESIRHAADLGRFAVTIYKEEADAVQAIKEYLEEPSRAFSVSDVEFHDFHGKYYVNVSWE